MKISYQKLQSFFAEPLPSVSELAQGIIFHAFEVEEIIPTAEDAILDIKILPDRAFDCKDEAGLAKEISVIFNLPLKNPQPQVGEREVGVALELINQRLGLEVPVAEVIAILTRLDLNPIEKEGVVTCSIPVSRPDIILSEHLIKEVGRIYGYDKIPATSLSSVTRKGDAENFLKVQMVRSILLPLGFTEVYGYSFAEKGEVEVLKPLQQDKPFLRTNLTDGLKEKLDLNLKNVLFDDEVVKIFDIGSVFENGKEDVRVVVGTAAIKPKFHNGELIKTTLSQLGISDSKIIQAETFSISEFSLDQITSDSSALDVKNYIRETIYQKFSVMPKVIRDIAIFVPDQTNPEEVAKIIETNAGELLVREPVLFDQFSKEGRTSLAFRLVFQAFDRTLTDEEVGPIMEKITQEIERRANFEVRK